MIRRKPVPEPETTAQDDAPVPEAVPDDLAAAAEQLRAEATERREHAARCVAEAAEVDAAAAAEIDRISRDAETRRRELGAEAARDEQEAVSHEERAGLIAAAAAEQVAEADAEQRVADLEDERTQLAERAADLDGGLADLAADRERTEQQLADAGDLDGITQAQSRLTAIDYQAAKLTAQRAAVAERAEAVGDGEGAGELATARSDAQQRAAAVMELLDRLWPARAGAEARRAAAELHASLAANLDRIYAEGAAQAAPVRGQFVHS